MKVQNNYGTYSDKNMDTARLQREKEIKEYLEKRVNGEVSWELEVQLEEDGDGSSRHKWSVDCDTLLVNGDVSQASDTITGNVSGL